MNLRELGKSDVIIFLCLALWVLLVRLPSLDEPFDNDSAANAYHARLIVRGEPLYGTHHPSHHLPGVYYTYALGFLLLGDSAIAIKWLLIPWMIAATYLVYRLGKLLSPHDVRSGLLAAALFALLTASHWLKGTTAECELFASLPRIAAVYLAIRLTQQQAQSWKFAWVGVLSAIAFFYKAVYLSQFAIAVLVVALDAFWLTKQPSGWKKFLGRGVWISIGGALVAGAVAGYFYGIGLLPRFLMVFTYGSRYIGQMSGGLPVVVTLFGPVFVLLLGNSVALILSLGGLVSIVQQWRRQTLSVAAIAPISVVAWYLLSLVEAGVNRFVLVHYSLLVLPALSLLASRKIMDLRQHVAAQVGTPAYRRSQGVLVALVLMTFLLCGATTPKYYYQYFLMKLGLDTQEAYWQEAVSVFGSNYLEIDAIVRYVREHTEPGDFIFVWSEDPQIYYYADRLSPIETVWPFYAEAMGPVERIFGLKTQYIVLGTTFLLKTQPTWLAEGIKHNYTLETTIGENAIYRRVP